MALLGVGLVALVVLARTVGGPSETLPEEALSAELEALRAELEAERRARHVLAEEVSALRGDLLRATAPPALAPELPPPARQPEPEPETAAPPPAAAEAANAPDDEPKARFDSDALRASGIADFEIEDLHERWEQYELAKLAIDDRALRKGWSGRPRHLRQLRALDAQLRSGLGADGYDAFLYATGRENRLVVGKPLSPSAAQASGLQSGDVVWSYDGSRIFHDYELARLAATGPPGEYVRMQVVRGGRRISLGMERGPVGALFDPARRPPAGR